MLEFRRALSNARHAVCIADRIQSFEEYDSKAVDAILHSAEAELEEFLATPYSVD